MFCGNCGRQVPDTAIYCGGCGQAVAAPASDVPSTLTAPPAEPTTEAVWIDTVDENNDAYDVPVVEHQWVDTHSGRSRRRRLIPALVVAAAVVAGATAYVVVSREDDPAPEDVAAETEATTTSTTSEPTTTSPPAPDTMPAVVGKSLAAATTVLNAADIPFDVEERESIQPPGTVMDQTPAAGSPLPARAQLVVAKRAAPLSASSRLRLNGFGGVEVGMTVPEAERAAGRTLVVHDQLGNGCMEAEPVGLSGVSFMVVESRIVRIDIFEGPYATQSGIRVGASESAVRSTYGGQIETTSHPYDESGHYLIFRPKDSAQQKFLLIFETDGNRVLRFRSGERDPVGWIEGCA
jgi:hypothetical protein